MANQGEDGEVILSKGMNTRYELPITHCGEKYVLDRKKRGEGGESSQGFLLPTQPGNSSI